MYVSDSGPVNVKRVLCWASRARRKVFVPQLEHWREPASGAADDVENLTDVGANRFRLAMPPDLHRYIVGFRSRCLVAILRRGGPSWVLLGWDVVAPHCVFA